MNYHKLSKLFWTESRVGLETERERENERKPFRGERERKLERLSKIETE